MDLVWTRAADGYGFLVEGVAHGLEAGYAAVDTWIADARDAVGDVVGPLVTHAYENTGLVDPHPHAVCVPTPPLDEHYVLYCSGSYLEAGGHVSPWHANGLSATPGRFDTLASAWCLRAPAAELDARRQSSAFRTCLNSTWWPEGTSNVGNPLDAASAAPDAVLGEGTAARSVFAALGDSDLPLSAKALFCLCEVEPAYVALLTAYSDTLVLTALPYRWVPYMLLMVLPFLLCVLMGCPVFTALRDTSKYYDKDLV